MMLPGPQSQQPTNLGLAGAGRQTGETPPPAGTQSLPVVDETVLGCHFTQDTPKQMRTEDASRGPRGDDREGWSCQDCVRTFNQPHKHVRSNLLRTPCPTVTGVSWQAWCSAPQPALADRPPSESKLREAPIEALDFPSIHGPCVM